MQKRYLKIGEFSSIAGISRKALIFFDQIGLLSPEKIDPDNGYRYYSYRQIDTASVINSFRTIGMPLQEIKTYLDERSPERFLQICDEHLEKITQLIARFTQIKHVLHERKSLTAQALTKPEGYIGLQTYAEENLFIGPPLQHNDDLEAGWYDLPDFYAACRINQIEIGLPVGSLVLQELLQQRCWPRPAYYYYRLPAASGYPFFHTKPAGLYAVGSMRTDYGKTGALYQRLFQFIEENKLELAGNAYEEFLLDEIAADDPSKYVMQISIQVRCKQIREMPHDDNSINE